MFCIRLGRPASLSQRILVLSVRVWLACVLVRVGKAQKCSDGVDAFVQCQGVCETDPSLNCEMINGQGYCCGGNKNNNNPNNPNNNGNGCQDKTTECASKSYVCQRQQYNRLMRIYCPKTCNMCGNTNNNNNNNNNNNQQNAQAQQCSDKYNMCSSKSFLCNVNQYKRIMGINCKQTCGMC